jgi:hypothetical protein
MISSFSSQGLVSYFSFLESLTGPTFKLASASRNCRSHSTKIQREPTKQPKSRFNSLLVPRKTKGPCSEAQPASQGQKIRREIAPPFSSQSV